MCSFKRWAFRIVLSLLVIFSVRAEEVSIIASAREAVLQADYKLAERLYKRAIKEQLAVAQYHFELGMVYVALNRTKQAQQAFEQAISLDDKHILAHYNLAKVYTLLDQREFAIAQYQQVLRLQPFFAPAYLNWGNLLMQQGEYDGAYELYHKSLELDNTLIEAYIGLVQSSMELGQLHEAQHYLELFNTLAPDDTRVRYWQERIAATR